MKTLDEPSYIAQTDEVKTADECQAWITARLSDAKAQGTTFHRATFLPDKNALLLEGWLVRPSDQGEARFKFSEST